MLLTYLVYRIYDETRLESYGDDPDSTFRTVLHFLGFVLFWPFLVLSLSRYLESRRHKDILALMVLGFTLFIFILSPISYLVVGLVCLIVRSFAYDWYAYKYVLAKQQEQQEESQEEQDNLK